VDFDEIVNSWLGTKFHYAGRIKKNKLNRGGIDCVGLIIKIGEELNAMSNNKNIIYYDYINYSRYPNCGEMKIFFDKHFEKIKKENLKKGNLIYFNFKNKLEHAAIYLKDYEILHCSASSKIVVKEKLTPFWIEKIVDSYKFRETLLE
jgi:cell wall-associated NlpC family hydrolase